MSAWANNCQNAKSTASMEVWERIKRSQKPKQIEIVQGFYHQLQNHWFAVMISGCNSTLGLHCAMYLALYPACLQHLKLQRLQKHLGIHYMLNVLQQMFLQPNIAQTNACASIILQHYQNFNEKGRIKNHNLWVCVCVCADIAKWRVCKSNLFCQKQMCFLVCIDWCGGGNYVSPLLFL